MVVLFCPHCDQRLRIPPSAECIAVTCPTCRHEWEWSLAQPLSTDFYDLLQVAPNACHEVIAAAFRGLARQFHPDRNPGDKTADIKIRLLNKAFEILGDASRRADYDRSRARQANAAHEWLAGQLNQVAVAESHTMLKLVSELGVEGAAKRLCAQELAEVERLEMVMTAVLAKKEVTDKEIERTKKQRPDLERRWQYDDARASEQESAVEELKNKYDEHKQEYLSLEASLDEYKDQLSLSKSYYRSARFWGSPGAIYTLMVMAGMTVVAAAIIAGIYVSAAFAVCVFVVGAGIAACLYLALHSCPGTRESMMRKEEKIRGEMRQLATLADDAHKLWNKYGTLLSDAKAYHRDLLNQSKAAHATWQQNISVCAQLRQESAELEKRVTQAIAEFHPRRKESERLVQIRAAELRKQLAEIPGMLARLPWRTFWGKELVRFLENIFMYYGYGVRITDKAVTGQADYGVDLVLTGNGKKIAVQAKGQQGATGDLLDAEAVKEVVTAMKLHGCDSCVVITNKVGFQKRAHELAEVNSCRLVCQAEIDRLIWGQVLP